MATEKILIFDEAGNAKRMKVRIARFLDNEPVTASDKENIRTTLDVDDSLSGTFTTPLSVTSASDSSFTGGGNVGIGTATPSAPLSVENSSNPKVTFGYGGLNAEHRLAWDSSKFNIVADAGDAAGLSEIGFFVDGSQRAVVDGSGNLSINNGNLVLSSGAIDFGSATTGTGTPSGGLLSDYEEGTFTPSLQFGGASTGITYSSQYGYYTKIGRLVTVHYHIALTSRGTSTGAAKIVGGPFVSANNAGGKDVTVLYPYGMASLNSTPFATHDQNSNTLSLYDTVAGGRDPLTEANFGNTAGINCTVTFEV